MYRGTMSTLRCPRCNQLFAATTKPANLSPRTVLWCPACTADYEASVIRGSADEADARAVIELARSGYAYRITAASEPRCWRLELLSRDGRTHIVSTLNGSSLAAAIRDALDYARAREGTAPHGTPPGE